MAWQELSITVPHEYVEPISYLFGRYGKGVSTELAGEGKVLLRTYLTTRSRQRIARIDVGVRLVGAIEPIGDLEIRELPEDEDWMESWKSHFRILRIGTRLVIKPTWLELDLLPVRTTSSSRSTPGSPSAPGIIPPPTPASKLWNSTLPQA